MNWYCLELPEVDEDIENMWRAAWTVMYAEKVLDFRKAMFVSSSNGAIIYFSPAARELADAFGANPCERPSPEDLHLVAGDDRAWQILFPGTAKPASSECGRLSMPSGFASLWEPTRPTPLD
jgi:hypothetical protein